jgi:hypothetical protein
VRGSESQHRKTKEAGIKPGLFFYKREELVAAAVPIAIKAAVIVAVAMPAVAIVAVGTFESLTVFETRLIELAVVVGPIVFDLEAAIGLREAAMAIAIIAVGGLRAGSAGEEKKPTQRGGSQRCLAKPRLPQTMQFHTSSLGASLAGLGCCASLLVEHRGGGNVAVGEMKVEETRRQRGWFYFRRS